MKAQERPRSTCTAEDRGTVAEDKGHGLAETLDKNTETQRSQEEYQQLQNLRIRDRETRAHEQAHLAAAGGLARGAGQASPINAAQMGVYTPWGVK